MSGRWWQRWCLAVAALGWSTGLMALPVHNILDGLALRTLSNGLHVAVLPRHDAPLVWVGVFYRAGSADEDEGATGLAHLLEHVMFQGTPRVTSAAYNRAISERGAVKNAITNRDLTAFVTTLPKAHWTDVLGLEADRMASLRWSPKAFRLERQVVMEERRLRVDTQPDVRLLEQLYATALVHHPYHHLPIGWMSDIAGFRLDDAQRWHRRWYVPSNAWVVVVGDVTPRAAFHAVQERMGWLPRQPHPDHRSSPRLRSNGPHHVTLHAPAPSRQFAIGFEVPTVGTARHTWEPYALMVLAQLLSSPDGVMGAWVMRRNIAYGVDSAYEPFHPHRSLLVLMLTPKDQASEASWQARLFAELHTLAKEGPAPGALQRQKTVLKLALANSMDGPIDQGMILGSVLAKGLPATTVSELSKHIDAVTRQQLQWVVAHDMVPQHMTWATLIPTPLGHHVAGKTGNGTRRSG